VTRVTLDHARGCAIPGGSYRAFDTGLVPSAFDAVDVALHSVTAELLRYRNKFEANKRWCDQISAPFFDLYNKLKDKRPKTPLVALPATQITWRRAVNIQNLELDAEEIRYFVDYLSDRCWSNEELHRYFGRLKFDDEEVRTLELLDLKVQQERLKIQRLKGIADILETVEPHQRR
jgi:hypothetical protein